jgi:hypothetical protein
MQFNIRSSCREKRQTILDGTWLIVCRRGGFQMAISITVWDSQYLGEVEGTVLTVEDPGYVVGVEKESVFLPADVGERWV